MRDSERREWAITLSKIDGGESIQYWVYLKKESLGCVRKKKASPSGPAIMLLVSQFILVIVETDKAYY